MRRLIRAIQRVARAVLARADAWCNAMYSWRYNPLYHTGALVVACFLVLSLTGLYLLLFYRIGSPYASVERVTDQVLAGRWIRTLHRYMSDLAIAATAVHAFRMFAQDRAWGPRALAWLSGLVLVVVFSVCGWTGYVMVWDVQAQILAVEGARLLDFVPVFSEPLSRTFVGERPIPGAFFFMNLFAHIAIPVGIALLLWIHVSRLARASVMPPRPLLWGMTALFIGISVVWPVSMAPEADLLRAPSDVQLDVFYGFWLPFTSAVTPAAAWLGLVVALGALSAVPLLTRPLASDAREPSWVNARVCTGCEQCYHDCPYEAISMVPRVDGREGWVALVEPANCVSCGICAGSCAPMSVGPPGRTGRDQLEQVKAFIGRTSLSSTDVVVVGCQHSASGSRHDLDGAPVLEVSCVGAMHTSVIEYLTRAGVGGVMVVTCPQRDCWNREGVTLLDERVHHGREAELQARVDRRRVRITTASSRERDLLTEAVRRYRADIAALGSSAFEEKIDIVALCEAPEVSVAERT